MAMVRDVSQRKAVERALGEREQELRRINTDLELLVAARTAELSEANRELEAFSYSVAHDLRAPLRQIEGFARLLDERLGPDLSADAAGLLARVRSGTQHMSQLISDLLELAHISRTPLRLEHADLSAVVRDCISDLSGASEGRAIDWRVGPLPRVECDPFLMRIVFSNLLANAVKFTQGRPLAVIEVGTIEPTGEPPTMFVRDNGIGFDMAYASKVFGVFERLHSEDEFPGTGIGLATVHRVIRRHGGRVWADAREGEGATFFFTLAGVPNGAPPPPPPSGTTDA
jgi:light-regulated signal transduction histidine kinase (bacteriophytochrome)